VGSSKRAVKLSARALRNITWIETNCRVPDGHLVGQPVKLSPAQRVWLEMIYGTPTRTFICSIPRKNAKTTTAAFLMLLHLVGPEAVPNGQLFSAAQSRDQAAILFALASKIVRMSEGLSQYVSIKESAKTMICSELGTVYKAISAEASTAFGLSCSMVIHDETGQVRGPRSELYEALETASAAQKDPLSIVISTQAPSPSDLLSLLIADAQTGSDPRIKCIVYQVPEDADVFDPVEIAKAQPNWHLMNQSEVLKMAADAKRMPSREASYRNYICNQQVEANNPFITRSVWLENGAAPDDLDGQRVWGGLDLSSVSDLTALVLVTEGGDVHPTFWLPAEGLEEKARNDRTPWDLWAEQGHLQTTPGRAIEYEYIASYLRDLFDRCDIVSIAFDRYNMRFLTPWLESAGFSPEELEKFVEFGQGFVSQSPAIRELESKLLQGKLKHGNHPVLELCAKNAVCVDGPTNGTRKFAKQKATGRIDGMVALAQAVGVMPMVSETNEISQGFLLL
jgi:phage terminase large subunit-like protein